MKDYVKPVIIDYGSLAELTADCDHPGAGDHAFPDGAHTSAYVTSSDFCFSKP